MLFLIFLSSATVDDDYDWQDLLESLCRRSLGVGLGTILLGAAYALLWSVKGDKITPTEHYVTPDSERTVLFSQNEPKHYLA